MWKARCSILPAILLLGLISSSCSGRNLSSSTDVPAEHVAQFEQPVQVPSSGLDSLPADRLQPWEYLGPVGFTDSGTERTASLIDPGPHYTIGKDTFRRSSTGELTEFGQGLRIDGSSETAWTMYRVPLGDDQPTVVSLYANLRNTPQLTASRINIGVSNYGSNRWEWHGPSEVGETHLLLPAGDYTSSIGNTFITILATEGNALDLNALTVGILDEDGDPAQPGGLNSATVRGGSHLTWNEGTEEDLLGYRVEVHESTGAGSYRPAPDWHTCFVQRMNELVVPRRSGHDFFTVCAVDIHGNLSPVSGYVAINNGSGDLPESNVLLDPPSGPVSIEAATSVEETVVSWSFDFDGDGTYEVSPSDGSESFTPAGEGLLEIHALGYFGPEVQILQTLSFLSLPASWSPPEASATATPDSGPTPLEVQLDGSATDPDNDISMSYWDFDGDGFYDYSHAGLQDPDPFTYTEPGIYTPVFRVEDEQGNFDTVQLQVNAGQGPDLIAPVAIFSSDPPHAVGSVTVLLDASASYDDGEIVEYEWKQLPWTDWVSTGSDPTIQFSYEPTARYHSPKLRVTDDDDLVSEEVWVGVVVDRPWEQLQTVDDNLPPDRVHLHYFYPASYPIATFISSGNVYRCLGSDPNGKGWGPVEQVTDTGTAVNAAGTYGSVVYFDSADETLYRCWEWQGDWYKEVINSGADFGQHLDLDQEVNDEWISYYDADNGDLYVANLTTETGDPISYLVDSDGDVGRYSSILCPANNNSSWWVAYYDATNGALKFAAEGNDIPLYEENVPQTLDDDGDVGMYCSLAASDASYDHESSLAYPAISYYDADKGDLKYIQPVQLNTSPTQWSEPLVLDSDGDVGSHCQLLMCYNDNTLGQTPLIVYNDDTNGTMKYIRSSWLGTEYPEYWAIPFDFRDDQPDFSGAVLHRPAESFPGILYPKDGELQFQRKLFSGTYE